MSKRLPFKKWRDKNARRLTPALLYVAASKYRHSKIRTPGTFGAASEVRVISPDGQKKPER